MVNMLSKILPPATAGAVFGAALTASGVYHPTVIIKQMQLQDFHMLQVFLTASATSAIVLLAFEKLGAMPRKVRSSSSFGWLGNYDANVIGGFLIGLGMTLSGACPGTVIVQLASGIQSGRYVALGCALGGVFFSRFGHILKKEEKNAGESSSSPPPAAESFASKLNFDETKTFLAFETLCTVIVAAAGAVAVPTGSYAWMHPVAGGLLIGGAQAVSVSLTSSTLGVSTAYEQIGQYFWRALGRKKDVVTPASPPSALVFVLGMLAGSAVLAMSVPPVVVGDLLEVSKPQAVVGGFLMVVGARSAGGCTSGHGISGLSALSFSSLVTVVSMFGGGIATAMLLR